MWPPPLFRDRHVTTQIVLAAVLPIGFGALCGFELGTSEGWFNALMLGGGFGGTFAGFEHDGARRGARRGLVGGALFASALAITFFARGAAALAWLPAPLPVMIVSYAVMGVPLGALGGWLRARSS